MIGHAHWTRAEWAWAIYPAAVNGTGGTNGGIWHVPEHCLLNRLLFTFQTLDTPSDRAGCFLVEPEMGRAYHAISIAENLPTGCPYVERLTYMNIRKGIFFWSVVWLLPFVLAASVGASEKEVVQDSSEQKKPSPSSGFADLGATVKSIRFLKAATNSRPEASEAIAPALVRPKPDSSTGSLTWTTPRPSGRLILQLWPSAISPMAR